MKYGNLIYLFYACYFTLFYLLLSNTMYTNGNSVINLLLLQSLFGGDCFYHLPSALFGFVVLEFLFDKRSHVKCKFA